MDLTRNDTGNTTKIRSFSSFSLQFVSEEKIENSGRKMAKLIISNWIFFFGF